MTRILLAAGVAALAMTAPAASQPGDRGGGKDRAQAQKSERGGNARAQRGSRGNEQRAQRSNRSEQRAQRSNRSEQRAQRSNRSEQRAQRSNRSEQRAQRSNRSEQRAQRENRSNEQRAQRSNRSEQRAQRTSRANEQRAQRVNRGNEQRAANARQQRAQAQRGNSARQQQAQRLDQLRNQRAQTTERRANVQRVAQRQNRQLERIAERRGFQLDRNAVRGDRQLARLAERNVIRSNDWDDLARSGVWLDGCPPGLAKKMVACVPPGQVKNLVGQPLSRLQDRVTLRELPNRLRAVYADTDDYYYRYGNGYAYRVDRSDDVVRALLPLFGLGLTTGQAFPSAYSNYYLPTSLQSFYPDYSNASYRYANGYVYQINPMTGLIQNVDPLLGYGYGYGQMMPATYSAYNVPYQYRSMYYDSPDHYYRYAPGAIYQVDPSTSLITAVSALLTGGMNVGQPLPSGYGVYNVPYQYRTTYYDTPNDWYRYSNGYVYRVDPTTQLVTAIVASVLT